jgi:hypothetical protein
MLQYSGGRDSWYSIVAAVCRHKGGVAITGTLASACVPRNSWLVLRVVIPVLGIFLHLVTELDGSGVRKM